MIFSPRRSGGHGGQEDPLACQADGPSAGRVSAEWSGPILVVVNSTLDYPASLWMNTTNSDDTGNPGGIEARGSTFRSVGPESEGIWMVASGPGDFVDDDFETTANEGLAMLVTQPCHHENVTGVAGRCQSP